MSKMNRNSHGSGNSLEIAHSNQVCSSIFFHFKYSYLTFLMLYVFKTNNLLMSEFPKLHLLSNVDTTLNVLQCNQNCIVHIANKFIINNTVERYFYNYSLLCRY